MEGIGLGMAIMAPSTRDHGQDARATHFARGGVEWNLLGPGDRDLDDEAPVRSNIISGTHECRFS